MAWPLSQDYNEAIQSPAGNFADPDLKSGEAATNALGLPMPFSGNFADVYEVRGPNGGRWAVKCFTREVSGLRERYTEISRHLRQAKLPFMVDFSYLEQGIRVGSIWYPVLKMQWVEGLTLNQFVFQNLDKSAMLEALLQIWGRMAKALRSAEVGHCDLQHGNVLLVPGASANSLALKLIDYDGMWVPALAGKSSGELGHPSYQHPQRLREQSYSIEVDRFPLLLIATALRALKVQGKALWDKFDNGDNLLFKEVDLRAPGQSKLFEELLLLGDLPTVQLTGAVHAALQGGLAAAPLLEAVLAEAQTAPAPGAEPVPRQVVPQTGRKAPVVRSAPTAAAVRVISMKEALAPPEDDASDYVAEDADSDAPATRRKKDRRSDEPEPELEPSSAVPMGIWAGVIVGGGALLLVLVCGGFAGAIYWATHRQGQVAQVTTPVQNPATSPGVATGPAPNPTKPAAPPNTAPPPPRDKPGAAGNIVLSDWQVTGLEGFSWKERPFDQMKYSLNNGVLEITNNKIGGSQWAGITTKRVFTGDYTITVEVRNVTKAMGLREPNDDGFTTVWDWICPTPVKDWHTVVIRCSGGQVAMTVDGKAVMVGHPHPGKIKSAYFYIHIDINETAAIRRFEFVEGVQPQAQDADALAQAVAEMNSPNRQTRQGAMDQLLRSDPKLRTAAVLKAMEALLAEADGGVRNNAIRVLGIWGNKESVPALLAAIDHENVETRRAALEALGKCRDPRAVDAVARHLANAPERGSASKALQFMGPMAERAVIPYLGVKDWGLAAEACQILRIIGAKDSVVPMVALVKSDRSFLFRSSAEEAAECVMGRAELRQNKDLVPALVNQLENGPADKRKGVLEALGRSRDPRALEALAKCFANGPDRGNTVKPLQYMGPMAESAVLPYLKEKDWGTASDACQVLRVVGAKDSIAPLEELVKSDRSFLFRSSAEEALECVKGRAEPQR